MMKRTMRIPARVLVLVGAALAVVAGCNLQGKGGSPGLLPDPYVTVPELRGRTADAAALALATNSLILGRTTYTDDASWADLTKPGLVVAQSETPGARLPRNTMINVTVYRPALREYGEVPDVQGMKYGEAVAALEKAGYAVGEITRRKVEDERLYDIVYTQSPVPGTSAKRRSKVDLGLYGPTEESFVRVPRLTGLKASEVAAVLTGHGLEQGEVTYEPAPGASFVGTVRGQSLAIGTKVKPGTKVDLIVYAEPVPRTGD